MVGARWIGMTLVTLVTLLTLLALLTLFGCSSAKKSAAVADASPFCPATVGDTAGAACVEGQKPCYPEYPCGFFNVTATCTCSGGTWGCTDVTGTQLASSSDTPNCPTVQNDAGACPASVMAASGNACGEVGQLCEYKPACDAGMFDQCECFPGTLPDGGLGPLFECSSPCAQ
jgi:hypothetical protein